MKKKLVKISCTLITAMSNTFLKLKSKEPVESLHLLGEKIIKIGLIYDAWDFFP